MCDVPDNIQKESVNGNEKQIRSVPKTNKEAMEIIDIDDSEDSTTKKKATNNAV